MGKVIGTHVNAGCLAVVLVVGERAIRNAGTFGCLGPCERNAGSLDTRPVGRALVGRDIDAHWSLGLGQTNAENQRQCGCDH